MTNLLNLIIELEERLYSSFKKNDNLSKTDILLLALVCDPKNKSMYDIKKMKIIDPSLLCKRIKYLEENKFIKRTSVGRVKRIRLEEKGLICVKKIISFQYRYLEENLNYILEQEHTLN